MCTSSVHQKQELYLTSTYTSRVNVMCVPHVHVLNVQNSASNFDVLHGLEAVTSFGEQRKNTLSLYFLAASLVLSLVSFFPSTPPDVAPVILAISSSMSKAGRGSCQYEKDE